MPLFYYLVHIYLIHALAMVLIFAQGGELRRVQVVNNPASVPDWYGVSLPGVYMAWAIVVALMYWPCRWFAKLKAESDSSWLRYL